MGHTHHSPRFQVPHAQLAVEAARQEVQVHRGVERHGRHTVRVLPNRARAPSGKQQQGCRLASFRTRIKRLAQHKALARGIRVAQALRMREEQAAGERGVSGANRAASHTCNL
jgi:hypothetical protein